MARSRPKRGWHAPPRPWWRRRAALLVAGALALAALAAFLTLRPGPSADVNGEAAIPCGTSEMSVEHLHAHVQIFVRGEPREVPANIGIRANCLYWLHTHDATGLIHVEAGTGGTYTLGQFFTIWGQPLSATGALGEQAGTGESLRVLVNGRLWNGDPRNVPLSAHEEIVVELGPPFPAPQPFTFPPGS